MALINCKECGKKTSTDFKSCPNCGTPNSDGSPYFWPIIFTLGCFLSIPVMIAILNEQNSNRPASATPNWINSPSTTPSSPSTYTAPSSSPSSSTSLSGSSYWANKPNGNGRDWFNANYTQKKWLCDTMGRLSAKNDSQFYMDFFNSFYITNGALDPATSSTTMDQASNLADAATR